MDGNETRDRRRKRFDPLARPFEWYRLPLAIKLAFMQLWRKEQDLAPPTQPGPRVKDPDNL
jgi:hypothetical protein